MAILELIGASLLAFIIFLVIKYYVLTKMAMRFYANQGIKEYKYYPVTGMAKEWMDYSSSDNLKTIKYIKFDDKFKGEDAILSNLLDRALLIFTNPNLINEFLQNQQNYIKFEAPVVGFKQFLGNGIALEEGEKWKSKRKFISKLFKFDVVVNYLNSIRKISKMMLDRVENDSNFSVQKSFEAINSAISVQIFMGANIDDYKIDGKNPYDAIDTMCFEIFQHYLNLIPGILGERFVKLKLRKSDRIICEKVQYVRQQMKNIILDTIKREKSHAEQNKESENINIIALLIKEGHKLDEEKEIIDILELTFSLYFASRDTLASVLTMMLYYLIKNPDYFKLVEKEVLSLPQNYSFSDIQKLDFLQACFKETIRINTSAPILFTREAKVDHKIGNYNIQKGTYVNVGLISNQIDETYFKDPLTFNPNRWLDHSAENMIKENPFVYLPFSGGMRNCIGQHLANLQAKIVLVEFVKKYQIPQMPNDFVLEFVIKQNYQIKNPLILNLTKRQAY
ncbi:cytochrome P450 family monooxygenase (macronuclear) [Tetrahymena thermophila SB210]|uniref:Cytochrome P450 family monooxygenase n=2 Tax=Tetrahymena thermophila TaxID=5911 RepID=Q24BT7_TETTS|nr:cytochrome P450 family monooxygenase [Tetrahymena thermophila SB210]ABY59977.1 cytochrome P450 monooxygenase CYP5010A3 [Tetrahymena thermophila]EAS05241.2 cytochrome P450 family monooxygenase [Tetrahymena thermophila SB210]|eukprot:XP_001025486.2 cytochrome P450 family monooxygenase [Tetrahymena thermophila SB210]